MGHRMLQPVFFNQRHEQRAGAAEHLGFSGSRKDGSTVGLAANGSIRADDADALVH